MIHQKKPSNPFVNLRFQTFNIKKTQEQWRVLLLYLASERTESETIEEATETDLARYGYAFHSSSNLRPLVQEDDLSTVDDVSLHTGDVNVFLNLIHFHYVMVRRSSNLQNKTTRNIYWVVYYWSKVFDEITQRERRRWRRTWTTRWSLWWIKQ